MKEIKSLLIDFSEMEHINKVIYMYKKGSLYYIWVQDETEFIIVDDVEDYAYRTRNKRVAEEVFDFYRYFLAEPEALSIE